MDDGNPSANKRKDVEEQGPTGSMAIVPKKQKTDEMALVAGGSDQKALSTTIQRTSSLMAPIMMLAGHQAEIFSMKFSHAGKHLISGGFERLLYVWEVYGECKNTMVFRGHTNAILEVCWSADDTQIYSASADKTVAVWDSETGARIKKLSGHTNIVNAVSCTSGKSSPLIATGSDDAYVKLWDPRHKASVQSYFSKYAILSTAFSHGDPLLVFAGGLDNDIKGYDMRKSNTAFMTLAGHQDSVTGLRISPDGSFLLSNGMDNTVRLWDIRPYAPNNRNIKVFQGVQHNFEKTLLRCSWSPDGSKVSAGSADRFVYVWDTATRKILYKLPGHKGTVNETDFHPKEPIVASCSSDKTIYLGEIGL